MFKEKNEIREMLVLAQKKYSDLSKRLEYERHGISEYTSPPSRGKTTLINPVQRPHINSNVLPTKPSSLNNLRLLAKQISKEKSTQSDNTAVDPGKLLSKPK